jgi:hypothetical protein
MGRWWFRDVRRPAHRRPGDFGARAPLGAIRTGEQAQLGSASFGRLGAEGMVRPAAPEHPVELRLGSVAGAGRVVRLVPPDADFALPSLDRATATGCKPPVLRMPTAMSIPRNYKHLWPHSHRAS